MSFDFGLNPNPQPSNSSSTGKMFVRHNMDTMKDQKMPEWLIRDVMFERQVGVLYGKPGSFKSFIIHDLAARLVHGMEWQGQFLKPRRVIYVAGEGYSMFYHRRLAWFKHSGLEPENDGLDVIHGAVDLTNFDEVVEFIRQMKDDCDDMGLVVFDTLSTCIAGENESDSAVLSLVVQHARLIGDALNSTVLFVHHPGKDEARGARGSSALKGNIDFELHHTRDGLNCTVEVTKQKDGKDGQKYHYIGTEIFLGRFDEDGIEMSSMAFTPLTAPSAKTQIDIKLAADLHSVVMAMPFDEPLSLTKLARKLSYLGKERSIIDRINACVPTEWTRAKRNDEMVTVRRVIGTSGSATLIQMQPINRKTEVVS